MYSPQRYLNVLYNQWVEMFQYLKCIKPRGCFYKHTNVSPLLTYPDTKLWTAAPRTNPAKLSTRCLHQQRTAIAAARMHISGRQTQGKAKAHDVNKNRKHSVSSFVKEGCRKVCLLERGVHWRGGLCFQLQSIRRGLFWKGDERAFTVRELLPPPPPPVWAEAQQIKSSNL